MKKTNNLPTAKQMETLLKSILSGYKEGFNNTNKDKGGATVDFQMPLTFLHVDVYDVRKNALDKALKEKEIEKADYDKEIKKLHKNKVKTAYIKLEKLTKYMDYRPVTYEDWIPGKILQKFSATAKGWIEENVPEGVDVPVGAELAAYRLEYEVNRTDILYQTYYPFEKASDERLKPWKQIIYYRVLSQLAMGGIEYSEAMYRMKQRKQMEAEAEKERNRPTKSNIEGIKTMRHEAPMSKDDKQYLKDMAELRKRDAKANAKKK